MITIRMQLESLQRELAIVNEQQRNLSERITALRVVRVDGCDHNWLPPMKGYEHEGQLCELCGINSIYWQLNKRK